MRVLKENKNKKERYGKALYAIALTISIMAFIPPEGLSMLGLSNVTIAWKAFMVFVLFILLIAFVRGSIGAQRLKIDSVALLILAIIVLLGLYTLFGDGSVYYYGQKVAYIAGPWLIVVLFSRNRPSLFIKVICYIFFIVCLINIFTIFLYLPRGSFRPEIGDYWLFGQRTYMRNILFPGLLFSLINDKINKRRISFITIFFLVTNPLALFLVNSMTSLTFCLVLEVLVVAIICFDIKLFLLKILAPIAVIADILIVHVRSISFLNDFIVNTLGRNMTFSGRTQVWDLSIDALIANPFSGTGIQALEDSGFTLISTKQLSNAHNEFLDLTFKGGILTALAWIGLVIRCSYPLFKNKEIWISRLLGLFIAIFLFEAILGDVFYPEFFLILYMAAYVDVWKQLAN